MKKSLLYFSLAILFCVAVLTIKRVVVVDLLTDQIQDNYNGQVEAKVSDRSLRLENNNQQVSKQQSPPDNQPLIITKQSNSVSDQALTDDSSINSSYQHNTIINLILEKTPFIVFDQPKVITLPNIFAHDVLIEIIYQIQSQENALGFDDPGFIVSLNDKLIYQASWQDQAVHAIRFYPELRANEDHRLIIWSGNQGDQLKNTSTKILSLKLVAQAVKQIDELSSIDLISAVEESGYQTLEWQSPNGSDYYLKKALRYEIRSFINTIKSSSWQQADPVEIIFPDRFGVKASGFNQKVLIKKPPADHQFIAVGVYNSWGELVSITNLDKILLK